MSGIIGNVSCLSHYSHQVESVVIEWYTDQDVLKRVQMIFKKLTP